MGSPVMQEILLRACFLSSMERLRYVAEATLWSR